ncbi:MauE/DoxX family redox-associated membrane protein [Scopulibacillus darangshiensis]
MINFFFNITHDLIVLIFIGSAFHKITNWKRFLLVIKSYELKWFNREKAIFNTAFITCISEIYIFVGLSFTDWNIPYYVAVFLLTCYTYAISINLINKRRIECGCGGFLNNSRISPMMFLRNLLLLALVITLLFTKRAVILTGIFSLNQLFSLFIATLLMLCSKNLFLIKTNFKVNKEYL